MTRPLKNRLDLPLHVVLIGIIASIATFPLLFMNQLPAATDSERAFLASYAHMNNAALNSQSLSWNPLEFCGVPFASNLENRSLSPFSLPFNFLPLAYAFKLSVWLKLFVAGCTAYYASRKVGLSSQLSLFAAGAFQLSAIFVVFQLSPLADAAPWLPLCYLFAERVGVSQFRYWPLGALVAAAMILGGHLELLTATLAFFGIYAAVIFTILGKGRFPWPVVGIFALTVFLATTLAGIQLWPYRHFLSQTIPGSAEMAAWSPNLETLMNAVVIPGGASRPDTLLHLGLLHLLFLVLWGASRHCVLKPHRLRVDVLYVLSLVAYAGVTLHFAAGLSMLKNPVAWLCPAAFALALNSAAVADTWLTLNPEQCNSVLKRLGVAVSAMALIVAAGAAWVFFQDAAPGPRLAVLLAISALFVVLFFMLLAYTLLSPSHLTMGYITVTLIAAEQFITFYAARPQLPMHHLEIEPEYATAVKALGGRAGGRLAQFDVPLSVHGIAQTDAPYGRPLRGYQSFLERAMADPLLYTQTASATLLLTREDIQGPFSEIRPHLGIRDVSSDGMVLFQSLTPSQRATVIYEGRYEPDAQSAPVSSTLPPLLGTNVAFGRPPESPGQPVIMESEQPDRVVVTVESCGPGVLVLADAYAPGWTAYVDGEQTEVFSVDRAFRGVTIGADSTRVEFRYEPKTLRQGQLISLAGAVIVLLGIMNLIYFRLHNRYMRV